MFLVSGIVIPIDFKNPYEHEGFAVELINELKKSDGKEYRSLFKLTNLAIPDIRDWKLFVATIIFGGLAIFFQKPHVPAYVLKNQKELVEVELKKTDCDKIGEKAKINANNFLRAGQLMTYYLFTFPEGYRVYNHEVDSEPSPMDRVTKLNLCKIEKVKWYVDKSAPDYEFKVWWGYFLYSVSDDNADKQIIEEESDSEEEGLMEAFDRGMTL